MVFVTGGTGVLGAHLLLGLVKKNTHVRAIYRSGSNKEIVRRIFAYYVDDADLLFEKIDWVAADILDYESLADAMNGATEVYHAAAIVSFAPSRAAEMKQLNREGTANIVNLALEYKVEKFCHVSSVAALGDSKNGEPVDETSERSQATYRSAYSKSKYASEMEVWRGIAEGLNAVIVNPSIILAPGDWGRSSTKLFLSVWKGVPFHTPGVSGFVDVRDVVDIMIQLMEKEKFGQRFLLNSECWNYQKLFSAIAAALNRPAPKRSVSKATLTVVEMFSRLPALLWGAQPIVTRDTLVSAYSKSSYSNKLIKESLNYEFTPVNQSIIDIAAFFLQDQKAIAVTSRS